MAKAKTETKEPEVNEAELGKGDRIVPVREPEVRMPKEKPVVTPPKHDPVEVKVGGMIVRHN